MMSIFIDFMQSFDCINHKLLLLKMRNMGFDLGSLCWFRQYLTDRTQLTMANGSLSSILPVTCGVPQGSVLGPILFLIFVNDITTHLQFCKSRQYADDTVLYHSLALSSDITKVQTDSDTLLEWCRQNKMHINTEQTNVVVYGTKSNRYKLRDTTVMEHHITS